MQTKTTVATEAPIGGGESLSSLQGSVERLMNNVTDLVDVLSFACVSNPAPSVAEMVPEAKPRSPLAERIHMSAERVDEQSSRIRDLIKSLDIAELAIVE